MRLIDADKMIEELKTQFDALYRDDGELLASDHVCNSEDVNDLIELVNNQPTAFDVDKVKKRLINRFKQCQDKMFEFHKQGNQSMVEICSDKCDSFIEAYEIVKAGGIDDN